MKSPPAVLSFSDFLKSRASGQPLDFFGEDLSSVASLSSSEDEMLEDFPWRPLLVRDYIDLLSFLVFFFFFFFLLLLFLDLLDFPVGDLLSAATLPELLQDKLPLDLLLLLDDPWLLDLRLDPELVAFGSPFFLLASAAVAAASSVSRWGFLSLGSFLPPFLGLLEPFWSNWVSWSLRCFSASASSCSFCF